MDLTKESLLKTLIEGEDERDKLHKSMEEVLSMTEEEFVYWLAYFKVKADKERLHSGNRSSANTIRRNR